MDVIDDVQPRPDTGVCVDLDNDGHPSAVCGGDDCDDNNPRINPGIREACDNLGVDEDCDPCTVAQVTPNGRGGDGDADGDGFPSTACFNVLAAGAAPVCASAVVPRDGGADTGDGGASYERVIVTDGRTRGTDCADSPAEGGSTRFPGATEICNMADDNCDGRDDEGVQFTVCYADMDRDTFARMGASSMTMNVCAACPAGYTARAPEGSNIDCDDTDGARYPGNVENCDNRDNDCDSSTDDAANDARVGRPCMASGGGVGRCATASGACVMGALTCRANTALPELCNGDDDDCDGSTDEPACVDSHTAATGIGYCAGSGECVMTACNVGRGNCDGDQRNGCEAALANDVNNCGACGVRCWSGSCVAGACTNSTAAEIDAGGGHTCARFGGAVICWGGNSFGQLGDGTMGTPRRLPNAASGISDAVEVSLGGEHSCVRRASGAVLCWGRNTDGRVGDGTMVSARTTAVAVLGLLDAVQISAGATHTCARRMGGQVVCWGANNAGQIGDGTMGTSRLVPTAVAGLTDAVDVSAGGQHTCARRMGGQVVCWGANVAGQIGNGMESAVQLAPTAVIGLVDAVEVSAGRSHTCARRMSGQVVCWGANLYGEAGDGTSGTNRPSAVMVDGLSDAAQVNAGNSFTCARRATGQVVCWGSNFSGQLGDGTTAMSATVVAVRAISDATELSVGDSHACVRRPNGRILCWGSNANGMLGDGTITPRATPTAAFGFADPVELSVGGRHACARLSNGRMSCWGFAVAVGDGLPGTVRTVPSGVAGLTDATQISAGGGGWLTGTSNNLQHTCARRATGQALCWGSNGAGQLGDGTTMIRATPAMVGMLSDVVEVSAGGGSQSASGTTGGGAEHSCARRATGQVVCWGANQFGQLGDGTSVATSVVPVTVVGVTDAIEVAAGATMTCARRATGQVVCWGANSYGQLGDAGLSMPRTVAAVVGLSDAVEIGAGAVHACARRLGGRVVCWGSNTWGQLGDGTTRTNSNIPVEVVGLLDAVEVSVGSFQTCARRASGQVLCWGANDHFQLGTTTPNPMGTPSMVTGVTDAIEISVGGVSACVRRPRGQVWCWGRNIEGQVGDGTQVSRFEPVQVIGL